MWKMIMWVLILVVGVAGVIAITNRLSGPTSGNGVLRINTYTNDAYGITFDYPDGYVLQETERGNAERGHYWVTLIRTEDATPPENGEGPTAISIDIYQNNLDKQTLFDWLTGTNDSNYKLSDGASASTTVAGEDAVSYRWSGLYEGETTAFLRNDNIVAISVTYLTPQDVNITVYRDLIKSIR